MKYIEWCDLFRIGHQVIDRQHQNLFDIANSLHDVVNKGFNEKIAIDTLNRLIKYAQEHFATEEKIAEQYGYPRVDLDLHKDVHEKLILQVFELNDNVASGRLSNLHEIENFLRNWLVLHILVEDKKYTEFLIKS